MLKSDFVLRSILIPDSDTKVPTGEVAIDISGMFCSAVEVRIGFAPGAGTTESAFVSVWVDGQSYVPSRRIRLSPMEANALACERKHKRNESSIVGAENLSKNINALDLVWIQRRLD